MVLFLPSGLYVLVEQGSKELTRRAKATPLILGAKGSATDLTLSALYFKPPSLEPIAYRQLEQINQSTLATGIPLNLRYNVSDAPIVGTSLDYTRFRQLKLKDGRWFGLLGECVLGAKAAQRLGIETGGYVLSSAGNAFDIAGSFPLKMPVVGILAETGTADDDAVFTDIKTTWVIAGLAHGHDDVTRAAADDQRILQRSQQQAVASPALLSYTAITPKNVNSFHFHGDISTFPIDTVIVVPDNRKAEILLRGRYDQAEGVQLILPTAVIGSILQTLFSIRDYIILGSVGVLLSTTIIATLVFALSIRLRKREIETIQKIGGSSSRLRGILIAEILIIIISAILIAGTLTQLASNYGNRLIQLIS